MNNVFEKSRRPQTHLLMGCNSTRTMAGIYFNHQKSIDRVIGYGWLMFPANPLLYSILLCYCSMENHFSEVKKSQTHLLMSFNSIGIVAGNIS